ncbi:MAG: DUF962 domain-containing protein [Gammaproteobacteria bacterium]|nr:DUF962 domain-containing protein [Gammaproteobacteria bacterium]
MSAAKAYRTLGEFYPFYLSEHGRGITRRLHFAGSTLAIALVVAAIATRIWWLCAVALVQAYAFAWIGHYFFEHNRPATFQYPVLSFLGDWRMWWEMLSGRMKF